MVTATFDTWRERAAQATPRTQLFIDGQFVDAASGKTFEDISPRDGRVITQVAEGDAEDIDRAVAAARRAFEDGRWANRPPAERKQIMLRWAQLVRERAEDLALLETLDVGKPIGDTVRVDAAGAANNIQYYAEAVDKIYDEIAPTAPDTLALVQREPLGVVGAVIPWNYPSIITTWKLGPALATGNSVVLKPAEQSPLYALLLAELASEAGVPDGVINVVTGFGPTAGAALGRHMDVDKITFTGSTEVGKLFLTYAGESNMKQVGLECGGKSPHIVFADAPDLAAAAEAIAWGVFYNAGETCNAGTRLLVDRRVKDDLLAEVEKVARTFNQADPLDPAATLGAMVSEEQMQRVLNYIRVGVDEGASVRMGGERVLEETGGYYVPPTIFDGVQNSMRIAQEEIFGPVLVTVDFDDEAEAVRMANDSQYGLASAVWTSNLSTAHRVAKAIRAGLVYVNTFDTADITIPFGGYKLSGNGSRDKSLHALHDYTQLKTTWMNIG